MTCCLLPESVLFVLAHVRELDKQLRDQQFLFSPEASAHLEAICAAVTELDAVRCAANQRVQVQIAENNKLRSCIVSVREQISQFILMQVKAVKKRYSQETEELSKYLGSISERWDEVLTIQQALMSQNDALQMQLEEFKGEQKRFAAALKDRFASKLHCRKKLDCSVKQTEKLVSYMSVVADDKVTRQSDFQMEKENFLVSQDNLLTTVLLTKEKMLLQKQVLLTVGNFLGTVHQKKLDTINHLGELMVRVAQLKSSTHEKAVALCQREEQLRVEIQKQNQLKQQSECFINEMYRMESGFRTSLRAGKKELEELQGLIVRDQRSGLPFQESALHLLAVLQLKQEEEDRIKVEHAHLRHQLEKSQLQLDECLVSNHEHKKEASELDGKIRDLLEADTNDTLEKNLEELRGHVDNENQSIRTLEEEKQKLTQLLDKVKLNQKQRMTSISSDTSGMRSRLTELQLQEAEFLNLHPACANPDQLLCQMKQCEREHKQLEHVFVQGISTSTAEREIISKRICEKLQLLEEKEEILMEIEAECAELQSRHNALLMLSTKLKDRGNDLEASAQRLKEKTSLLFKHQEEAKVELEETRAAHLHGLHQQAVELKHVEVTIYDYEVQLEQVRKENQLIRPHIMKMTKEVRRSKQLLDSFQRRRQRFLQDTRQVMEELSAAWLTDHASQSKDSVVLPCLDDTLNCFKSCGDVLV